MKLNYKRTFFVGFAFLSICAFWEVYEGIVPKMLEGTFGLGETKVGAIMAIDNVLALFLPIVGAISDKVNTRIGRRMPLYWEAPHGSCFYSNLTHSRLSGEFYSFYGSFSSSITGHGLL